MTMSRDAAEKIALDCLTWLAGNEDLLPVFMGATGLGTDDLRTAAAQPDFLGAVLDFVMMDDAWVIAFCDSRRLPYDAVMQARAALPGGEQVHWT